MYPDYRYPPRGQEKKRKVVVSDIQIDPAPKSKKMKVLTHRPRYIEPAVVPDFGAGSSSAVEATDCSDCSEHCRTDCNGEDAYN